MLAAPLPRRARSRASFPGRGRRLHVERFGRRDALHVSPRFARQGRRIKRNGCLFLGGGGTEHRFRHPRHCFLALALRDQHSLRPGRTEPFRKNTGPGHGNSPPVGSKQCHPQRCGRNSPDHGDRRDWRAELPLDCRGRTFRRGDSWNALGPAPNFPARPDACGRSLQAADFRSRRDRVGLRVYGARARVRRAAILFRGRAWHFAGKSGIIAHALANCGGRNVAFFGEAR